MMFRTSTNFMFFSYILRCPYVLQNKPIDLHISSQFIQFMSNVILYYSLEEKASPDVVLMCGLMLKEIFDRCFLGSVPSITQRNITSVKKKCVMLSN